MEIVDIKGLEKFGFPPQRVVDIGNISDSLNV
jgi:hypothetical protein